jgi:hypothetical protein
MHTYGSYETHGDPAVAVGFALFGLFITLVTYVWFGIVGSKLFKKVGYKNPWAAWVPVYNTYALLEVGNQQGKWAIFYAVAALLQIIPFLGTLLYLVATVFFIIALIYAYININKAFGKDVTGWTVFAVFLQLIWMTILAYGNTNQYDARRANGPYFMNKNATLAGANGYNGGYQNQQYNGYQPQQQGGFPQQNQGWNQQQAPQNPQQANPYGYAPSQNPQSAPQRPDFGQNDSTPGSVSNGADDGTQPNQWNTPHNPNQGKQPPYNNPYNGNGDGR